MLKIAVGAIVLLYPFVVYFGLARFEARYFGLLLVLFAFFRFVVTRDRSNQAVALAWAAILAGGVSFISGSDYGVLLYPMMVSLSFLVVFGFSLFYPPSVVEVLARKYDKSFSDEAVLYTFWVTAVWCVFFAINACLSFITVFITPEYWLIYNGLISYLCMGIIFVTEYCVRIRVKRRHA